MIALCISLAALVAIIGKGLAVINQMGRHTCHCMRASWILLTATSAVLLFDFEPSWPQAAFRVAVAALVLLERRAVLCGRGDAGR